MPFFYTYIYPLLLIYLKNIVSTSSHAFLQIGSFFLLSVFRSFSKSFMTAEFKWLLQATEVKMKLNYATGLGYKNQEKFYLL